MDFVIHLFVALHLLGMAALVGGWLAARFGAVVADRVPSVVVWGARAQLVTGIVLVGLHEMSDHDLNHMKIGVKLLLSIAAAAGAEIGASKDRKGQPSGSMLTLAGVAGLVAVLVATLWK